MISWSPVIKPVCLVLRPKKQFRESRDEFNICLIKSILGVFLDLKEPRQGVLNFLNDESVISSSVFYYRNR